MKEFIVSLGDAKISSKINAKSRYWQIDAHKRDSEKTALTSHVSQYQVKRIISRLRNATGTFQRVMEVILSTVE